MDLELPSKYLGRWRRDFVQFCTNGIARTGKTPFWFLLTDARSSRTGSSVSALTVRSRVCAITVRYALR